MKITKSKLKQIIKEELEETIAEQDNPDQNAAAVVAQMESALNLINWKLMNQLYESHKIRWPKAFYDFIVRYNKNLSEKGLPTIDLDKGRGKY